MTYIFKEHVKIVKGATKIVFDALFVVVISFFNTGGFRQVCIFYLFFWKTIISLW